MSDTENATLADVLATLERQVHQRTSELPMLSSSASQALQLMRRADVRTDQILAVLEQDPTLAARVLGVANSALYVRGQPVTSLRQAVIRLGSQTLKDVVYMAVYSTSAFEAPGYVELVRETFDHCVLVARTARRIVRDGVDPEMAFLAGLLHDVGRARCYKLLSKMPLARALSREQAIEAADRFHAQAGTALADVWNLPPDVVEACASHHAPVGTLASVVSAADVLAYGAERGTDGEAVAALCALGWSEAQAREELEATRRDRARAS